MSTNLSGESTAQSQVSHAIRQQQGNLDGRQYIKPVIYTEEWPVDHELDLIQLGNALNFLCKVH